MNIWIIMILVMIASYIIQATLQSRFNKYSKIGLPSGMSGKEVAEKMLRDNGIYNEGHSCQRNADGPLQSADNDG